MAKSHSPTAFSSLLPSARADLTTLQERRDENWENLNFGDWLISVIRSLDHKDFNKLLLVLLIRYTFWKFLRQIEVAGSRWVAYCGSRLVEEYRRPWWTTIRRTWFHIYRRLSGRVQRLMVWDTHQGQASLVPAGDKAIRLEYLNEGSQPAHKLNWTELQFTNSSRIGMHMSRTLRLYQQT